MKVWNIDEHEWLVHDNAKVLWKEYNDANVNQTRFKVGDVVQFTAGYNNDIRMQARIKAIYKDQIFVYNDCYWYPILDNAIYNITLA